MKKLPNRGAFLLAFSLEVCYNAQAFLHKEGIIYER